ncbi:unnamed protein product [Linum tenue]|uniref:Uncharacterized protein n=1 Tax=Linum tenue TaxID=586396 RepID=A0AAV0KQV7_9ROSI|nr:unnamed protein product [Linum tenue]
MDSALFYPNKNSKPFKTTRGFFHPTKTNSSRWTPHILPSSCLSTINRPLACLELWRGRDHRCNRHRNLARKSKLQRPRYDLPLQAPIQMERNMSRGIGLQLFPMQLQAHWS